MLITRLLLLRIRLERFFRRRFRPGIPDPASVKSILYIRMDGIGDAILSNGILDALPTLFPNATITVLCDKATQPLFAACTFASEVIALDKCHFSDKKYRHASIKALRKKAYDLILNATRSSTKEVYSLSLAAGAPLVAIAQDDANMPRKRAAQLARKTDYIVPTSDKSCDELVRHRDFIHFFAPRNVPPVPQVFLTSEDHAVAATVMQQYGTRPGEFFAVFCTGAAAIRNYPYMGQALAHICGQEDIMVFGLGAADDFSFMALSGGRQIPRFHNLCGRLSLRQSIALIKSCRLAIGVETGLAHAACALSIPNVVLLGGGHFGRFMPYSPLTTAVTLPLDCYGCNWRCRYSNPLCIQGILPATVAEAVRFALNNPCKQSPTIFMQHDLPWNPHPQLPKLQTPQQLTQKFGLSAKTAFVESVRNIAPEVMNSNERLI